MDRRLGAWMEWSRRALIDKAVRGFIDYSRFGGREGHARKGTWLLVALLLAAAAPWGCAPRQRPEAVEDSLTSGRITIVCAPEAHRVLVRERDAFQALYPQASIEIKVGTSREAVSALFAAACDVAAITREISPEERAAATQGGLELEGFRFARDALVFIVNTANPVENVAMPQLRDIYQGGIRSWSQLSGDGVPIRPVIQPVESDVTAYFGEQVMGGEAISAPVATEGSDSAVVARVVRERGALGYVGLAWAGPARRRSASRRCAACPTCGRTRRRSTRGRTPPAARSASTSGWTARRWRGDSTHSSRASMGSGSSRMRASCRRRYRCASYAAPR
jgi:ABC-type phosphate transport system, periplasmic component